MTMKTTNTRLTAWLGASALAGLLVTGVPFTTAEAQDTSATRPDTSALQPDTSSRAAAQRDTITQTAATDTTRSDSTQWGRTTDEDPNVQNPPGYRGMERPVNVFPADTADTSSAADATTRTSQLKRQDSISSENQNPPGYRGMERPVGTDTATAQQVNTEFIGTSSSAAVRAKWHALLKAALNQPEPTRDLQDAINNLRKEQRDAKAQTTEKTGTKKKAKTTKKQATTTRDTTSADTTMRRDTSRQQTETRQQSRTDSDSASTVRAGQDTTGDTTRYEVNAQEGRSAAGTSTGETTRDTTDVVHRERETPPGMGNEPPPYPSDSEQVWVEQQPSGDSVTIGFDSTANDRSEPGN